MKYITSIDDTEFNTPLEAMNHIFNHYGTDVIREKFDDAFELTNSDKDIDEIHSPSHYDTFSVNFKAIDIIKALDIELYTRLFKEWIERLIDDATDAFEFDEEESFTTIFGETIELV